MSGGSWDYFYRKLDDVAEQLRSDGRPHRAAFGLHLLKCAKALHDIEWVDSGDYGEGRENEAILKCIEPAALLDPATERAERALENLAEALRLAKRAP